jgi:hypothetical protein
MEELRSECAQRGEHHRADRPEPPAADPPRDGDRSDAERERCEPQHLLISACDPHRQPLQPEPAERCHLIELEWSGEFGEVAIADVDRDHLLIEPDGHAVIPTLEPDLRTGDDRHQRDVGPDWTQRRPKSRTVALRRRNICRLALLRRSGSGWRSQAITCDRQVDSAQDAVRHALILLTFTAPRHRPSR